MVSYTVLYKKEGKGFHTYIPELPITASYGRTFDEAVVNSKAAVEEQLQDYLADDGKFPKIVPITQEIIDTLADGGPEWKRFTVEVDLDEIRKHVKLQHEATAKIQQFFLQCKSEFGLEAIQKALLDSFEAGSVFSSDSEACSEDLEDMEAGVRDLDLQELRNSVAHPHRGRPDAN
ncbi:MAG: hypothetical protein SGILL_010484 [Bacillariaceae sp.]